MAEKVPKYLKFTYSGMKSAPFWLLLQSLRFGMVNYFLNTQYKQCLVLFSEFIF